MYMSAANIHPANSDCTPFAKSESSDWTVKSEEMAVIQKKIAFYRYYLRQSVKQRCVTECTLIYVWYTHTKYKWNSKSVSFLASCKKAWPVKDTGRDLQCGSLQIRPGTLIPFLASVSYIFFYSLGGNWSLPELACPGIWDRARTKISGRLQQCVCVCVFP